MDATPLTGSLDPAVPDDLFHEELEDDTVEDTQSNQPDVASELDDTETLDSELP